MTHTSTLVTTLIGWLIGCWFFGTPFEEYLGVLLYSGINIISAYIDISREESR